MPWSSIITVGIFFSIHKAVFTAFLFTRESASEMQQSSRWRRCSLMNLRGLVLRPPAVCCCYGFGEESNNPVHGDWIGLHKFPLSPGDQDQIHDAIIYKTHRSSEVSERKDVEMAWSFRNLKYLWKKRDPNHFLGDTLWSSVWLDKPLWSCLNIYGTLKRKWDAIHLNLTPNMTGGFLWTFRDGKRICWLRTMPLLSRNTTKISNDLIYPTKIYSQPRKMKALSLDLSMIRATPAHHLHQKPHTQVHLCSELYSRSMWAHTEWGGWWTPIRASVWLITVVTPQQSGLLYFVS